MTGELSLIVKVFGLGNAGGEIGPLTVIVAIKGMEEGKFHAERVKCFTATAEVASKGGWVYFTKSKGGCATMWQHYFKNVAVPTIVEAAEHHSDCLVCVACIAIRECVNFIVLNILFYSDGGRHTAAQLVLH